MKQPNPDKLVVTLGIPMMVHSAGIMVRFWFCEFETLCSFLTLNTSRQFLNCILTYPAKIRRRVKVFQYFANWFKS